MKDLLMFPSRMEKQSTNPACSWRLEGFFGVLEQREEFGRSGILGKSRMEWQGWAGRVLALQEAEIKISKIS